MAINIDDIEAQSRLPFHKIEGTGELAMSYSLD